MASVDVIPELRKLQAAIGNSPACFRALHRDSLYALTMLEDAINEILDLRAVRPLGAKANSFVCI